MARNVWYRKLFKFTLLSGYAYLKLIVQMRIFRMSHWALEVGKINNVYWVYYWHGSSILSLETLAFKSWIHCMPWVFIEVFKQPCNLLRKFPYADKLYNVLVPCTFNLPFIFFTAEEITYVLDKSRLMEQGLILNIYCNPGRRGYSVWWPIQGGSTRKG